MEEDFCFVPEMAVVPYRRFLEAAFHSIATFIFEYEDRLQIPGLSSEHVHFENSRSLNLIHVLSTETS